MPKIPVKPAPMNAESPTGRILVEGNPSHDSAWARRHFGVADHAALCATNPQIQTYALGAAACDFAAIEARVLTFHDALEAATWCPFCKRHHVGGDTCLGHHP